MGPSYACLYVGYIEEQIRARYTGFVPQLLKRYIDDVVGCAQYSRHDLQQYIDYVSNFHPALQFTTTISELELPFLDIKVVSRVSTVTLHEQSRRDEGILSGARNKPQ